MMGSYDAMFREFFTKEGDAHRMSVIKTGFILVLLSSTSLSLIAILFRDWLSSLFFGNTNYSYLIWFVIVSLVVQVTNSFAINPSKMVNNKKHIFSQTMLYAILFYTLSLGMLELDYGFISLILGQQVAFFISLAVFGYINRAYFLEGRYDYKLAKNILKIGLPLVPIFIIYWANNAIVRIFIVNHLGNDEMGVFALGSRYAAISSLLQIAFAGGWSYFTFSTMKDSDHIAIKSKVFKYLTVLISIFYFVVGLLYEPFFEFTFADDYSRASEVFPALFLAPLLLVLYQIVANQFTIIGKSYISLIALTIGLLCNLAIGYYGASIMMKLKVASASIPLGYIVTIICIVILGLKYKVFHMDKDTVFNFLGLVTLFALHYFCGPYTLMATSIVMIVLVFINKTILQESILIINRLIKSKFSNKSA